PPRYSPPFPTRRSSDLSLRSALARFAVRRAAASQREAPRRAELWLRLGCALAPTFAVSYPALVRPPRPTGPRWRAATAPAPDRTDRKSTRLNSSHVSIS